MAGLNHIDLALARRVLRGDEAAFEALFDTAYPRLYRFALTRLGGDTDAAAELAQASLCRALERLDSYRGEAALLTWMCQICRNLLVDSQRSEARQRARVVPIEDLPEVRAVLESLTAPLAEQPMVELWRRDARSLIQSAVDALPERYGRVLEWKYIDGLTVQEIAQRLEVSAKAAESTLTRARTAFRTVLTETCGALELAPPEPVRRS